MPPLGYDVRERKLVVNEPEVAQVHRILQEPEMIIGVWQASMAMGDCEELDEPTVLVAMRQSGNRFG